MNDDPTRRDEPIEPVETPSEPAAQATPVSATEPVAARPAGSPATSGIPAPASRLRWVIALGIAGLAIVVGLGAFVLLGSRPTPEALKYIPAEAAMVAEVRMDLPGDQLQKLGNLLAHFPGFKDQSTLPDKIDESFSRLLGQATNGSVDYRGDVKPWLSGPAFIAIPVPSAGADASASKERGLLSATTTGTVSCEAALEGQAVTHEPYRGLDLSIGQNGNLACVLDGRQALLGDPASVRAALDAKGNGAGMDRSERYSVARATLTGDQLATLFIDGASFLQALPLPTAATTPVLGELGNLGGGVPEWAMVGVRAEDDALVVDAVAAPAIASTSPTGAAPTVAPRSLPPTHPSVLAPMVPADAILFVEHQGTGVTLQNTIARLRDLPEAGQVFGILDAMAGGAESLVGWVDDAGVVALADGPTPGVGVLLVAADAQAALQQVRTINNIVALAAISGQGIEIRQADIAGVNVATVTIADLAQVVPPGSLPVGPIPSTGPIVFSFAARDRVVIVGSGEEFMTKLLNVQQGQRLGDAPAYTRALQRAIPNSRTTIYLGAPSAIALAKRLVPQDVLERFDADVLPYVDPFEALILTASEDAGRTRSRLVITVSPQ